MSNTPKAPRLQIDQQVREDEGGVSATPPTAPSAASGPEVASDRPEARASRPEPAEEPKAASATNAPADADEQGSDASREAPTPQDVGRGIMAWVRRTFPGHEHAFWGAVIGLLVAVFVFVIGFWRALFIVVLVCIGITIGQFIDGNPNKYVMSLIDRLFGDR